MAVELAADEYLRALAGSGDADRLGRDDSTLLRCADVVSIKAFRVAPQHGGLAVDMEFLRYIGASFAWPLWLVVPLPAAVGVAASFVESWSYHAGSYFGVSAFRLGAWLGLLSVLPVTVLVCLPMSEVTLLRSCAAGASSGVAAGLIGTGVACLLAHYQGLGMAWRCYRREVVSYRPMWSFFRSFVTDRWDDRYLRDKHWRGRRSRE
ncbi:hypothetical protein [Streptomyces buecherae]|uniref:Uncharacterized protein n=1 Tax=Streptomyces buecherae TaxID=2763006 RepID=A0A7H8NJN6_9ACTN|nr:hypothetical protein [Streptomyces buecherae]QKW53628.1 hypothetical protein HUT08_33360 [Streptomyces buecherae]